MNASLKTDDDDEDEAADRVRSDRKELLELCLRTTASISLCRCDRMDVQFSRVGCEDAFKITRILNYPSSRIFLALRLSLDASSSSSMLLEIHHLRNHLVVARILQGVLGLGLSHEEVHS